jgi:hypothetical protein
MAQPAEKMNRKQYVIKQLRQVERDQYEVASVEGCLNAVRPVLDEIMNGPALYAQIEKLVRAGNADRAVKLMEAMPIKSKHMLPLMALLGAVIAIAVGVAVFVLGRGGS